MTPLEQELTARLKAEIDGRERDRKAALEAQSALQAEHDALRVVHAELIRRAYCAFNSVTVDSHAKAMLCEFIEEEHWKHHHRMLTKVFVAYEQILRVANNASFTHRPHFALRYLKDCLSMFEQYFAMADAEPSSDLAELRARAKTFGFSTSLFVSNRAASQGT
jgi:hypothetical protein